MQRFYQKFICKVKQNFRESTLGNTFIVHDDTKKDEFHSNGSLRRSNKPGRPKTLDGKIDYKKLDLTCMVELHIEGLDGTAYTLIAYSKALKQKVTHCQARHKNQLNFSYNASFASQNVAKVMMKENGMPYSMASFKEVMASTYIAKLIFDKCRRIPNRKLISHTVKELFGWRRKAA